MYEGTTDQQQFMLLPSLKSMLFKLYPIIKELKRYAILIPTTWLVEMYCSTEIINSYLSQEDQILPEYLLYAPAYMQKRTHPYKLANINYLASEANATDKNKISIILDKRLPTKMLDTLYTLSSYKLSYSYKYFYRTHLGLRSSGKAIAD